MGGGYWDSDMYSSAKATRSSAGVADFDYDVKVKSGVVKGIHELLDPTKMKEGVRESRDSVDHPQSLPVAVIFDVTGSMGGIPRKLQTKLASLMDVIIAKAGIPDPQILVGAVGDSTCDQYPFQIGQFESDNRFDEQLRNIIIEGNGGGQDMESYALAYRFAAYHTKLDAFEKRGKKGYLVTMGDERPWPKVSVAEVERIFGVKAERDETVEELLAKASETWEIFHIFPTNANNGRNVNIQNRWKELLGERVIMLDNEDLVCETVASLVYMLETAKDLDTVVKDVGLTGKGLDSVKNALVPVASSFSPSAVAEGNLPTAHASRAKTMTRL